MGTATSTAWWQRVGEGVRVQLLIQRREINELAAVLGRGRQYVSRRLNGHEPFNMAEIEKIAEWLEVTVESLASTREVQD
ncbi:helix-turn-helix domain-containing protein [Microbacterium sp. Yaish 1]|uniref:helix-turn-helix domain-containing protein n=1 Tax=Microbacterium sp. Yaish 1 TaxID=2025014 RepID=UPI000B944827|nr:helix-turn-helix domain-containing protein [Microbacterium sp. Yaish 1]OYC97237.1 hypothetical protein CI089_01405 [Microbacterium sp. Yaish 1]